MVREARQRSRARLMGPAPRFVRGRPSSTGPMSAKAVVRRYPKEVPWLRRLRINRRREEDDSGGQLAWRRGMDEGHFLEQLRQIAVVFPDSRVIQE